MTGRESENEMWQKRIKNKIEKYKKEMPYLETLKIMKEVNSDYKVVAW